MIAWLRSAPVAASAAILAALALIAALKFAQSIAAPVVMGLVVAIVLAPFATRLRRVGVPAAVSASIALVLAALLLVLVIVAAGPVLSDLVDQVPRIEDQLRRWMEQIARQIRGLEQLGREIEATLSEGGEEAVKAAMPGLLDALWVAPNFAAQSLIFCGTLFFFLLTREDIYAQVPEHEPALRRADRAVSHYFVVVTLINLGLGAAVFGAMSLLGLPSALLWGCAAFALNFVLYLGPLLMMLGLLVAGMAQFTGAAVLLPPIAFLAINLTEAQFVTPALIGQRLRINPLGVFLAIVFGLWLWGPIGAIVSLPVVVWANAFRLALRNELQAVPHPA